MNTNDLLPCHLFEHLGTYYVINIEKMEACEVPNGLAAILNTIISNPDIELSEKSISKLAHFGLIDHRKDSGVNTALMEPDPLIPITYMYLFLTQSCNLRCIYCYGDGGEYGTGGSMDESTAFKAVDWLIEKSQKMKKIHLGFFGGEPFINFPLMKAVVVYTKRKAYEAGKEVAFFVTTNGTLLSDEIIDFIKEHEISVQVSFDGPKEVQDAQRPFANGQGSSYDSTAPKIKNLCTQVPKTTGHAVLYGKTNPQFVKEALSELGFTTVSLSPASLSLFNQGDAENQEVRDTQVQLQALEEEADTWLRSIQNRDKATLTNLKAGSASYGVYSGMTSLLHHRKKTFFCGAGRRLVGVSVTGDIYLCHRFVGNEGQKMGHVRSNEFYREEYLHSPTSSNPICASCFAKYYCAGGCKHDNLSSCGSIDNPSEDICRLRRRELELAAVLVSALSPKDEAFLVEELIIPPKPCPLDF